MAPRSELIEPGRVFGRLTVIKEVERRDRIRYIRCQCNCDNATIKDIRLPSLRRGYTQSCGCIAKEVTSARSIKHGLEKNPLYNVYNGMMRRCYNENDKFYKYYGGRGITVCKRWRDKRDYKGLKRFVKWAEVSGYTKGLEIDRRKNNSRYSPENCRWVTPKINANNRRKRSHTIMVKDNKGKSISLYDFFKRDGLKTLNFDLVRHRYQVYGWSAERAIKQPTNRKAK